MLVKRQNQSVIDPQRLHAHLGPSCSQPNTAVDHPARPAFKRAMILGDQTLFAMALLGPVLRAKTQISISSLSIGYVFLHSLVFNITSMLALSYMELKRRLSNGTSHKTNIILIIHSNNQPIKL